MDHRIQELEESLASALGALPDVRVPTAMLVLVAVMIWMLLVSRQELQIAPSLRDRVVHRRRQWTAARQRRAETLHRRPAPSTPRSTRRSTMAPSTPHRTASPDAPAFRMRWGRTAVFLVAVLALATFLVTGIASAFGAATVTVAGVALLVGVGSLATLRTLAVRDVRRRRAARVEEAFAEATSPSRPVRTSAPASVSAGTEAERETSLFDHQPETAAEHRADEPSATAEPAENAASAEIAESGQSDVTSDDKRPAVARVPRPMYLEADEVTRPQPEPLAPEAEPTASSSVQLKDGVSAEYQAQLTARANRRLDLDKVLERRRAI